MPDWISSAIWFVVAATGVVLVIRYRGRSWLRKWRSHI
jgi:hypothetical protein